MEKAIAVAQLADVGGVEEWQPEQRVVHVVGDDLLEGLGVEGVGEEAHGRLHPGDGHRRRAIVVGVAAGARVPLQIGEMVDGALGAVQGQAHREFAVVQLDCHGAAVAHARALLPGGAQLRHQQPVLGVEAAAGVVDGARAQLVVAQPQQPAAGAGEDAPREVLQLEFARIVANVVDERRVQLSLEARAPLLGAVSAVQRLRDVGGGRRSCRHRRQPAQQRRRNGETHLGRCLRESRTFGAPKPGHADGETLAFFFFFCFVWVARIFGEMLNEPRANHIRTDRRAIGRSAAASFGCVLCRRRGAAERKRGFIAICSF